jgi:steroid 5-alpha reductase family enzyme
MPLLLVAGLLLATAVAAMTVTALVARRLDRVNVVDVTWGLALILVAVVAP